MKRPPPFAGGLPPGASVAVGAAAILVIAAVAFVVFPQSGDRVMASQCRPSYEKARTFADTQAIDMQTPPVQRGRRQGAAPLMTCGELRKLGYVR